MRTISKTILVAAATGGAVVSGPLGAQRVDDLRPVGAVVLPGYVAASRNRLDFDAPMRTSIVPEPPYRVSAASAAAPHRVWYWVALAGAVAGAGTVVVLAARNCDAGCQDDGGWAYVPYSAGASAVLGALVGRGLGLLVDDQRRAPRSRSSKP